MKRLFALALLTSLPVIAQTPPLQVMLGCDKQGNTVVLIKANEPAQQAIVIPRFLCWKDI